MNPPHERQPREAALRRLNTLLGEQADPTVHTTDHQGEVLLDTVQGSFAYELEYDRLRWSGDPFPANLRSFRDLQDARKRAERVAQHPRLFALLKLLHPRRTRLRMCGYGVLLVLPLLELVRVRTAQGLPDGVPALNLADYGQPLAGAALCFGGSDSNA